MLGFGFVFCVGLVYWISDCFCLGFIWVGFADGFVRADWVGCLWSMFVIVVFVGWWLVGLFGMLRMVGVLLLFLVFVLLRGVVGLFWLG